MKLKRKSPHMTSWGIGPKFASVSAAIGIIIILVNDFVFPALILRFNPFTFLSGTILVILGATLCIIAAVQVHRAFDQGKLITEGVYAYVRNPVYAAWVLLIAPGSILVTGFLLLIVMPFIMYFLIRTLIVEEDEYLEQKFGKEYLDYKKRVNSIIPKLTK
jgi:protein-S-isoprenylcysteine O-methyltransferase Ste14